MAMAEAAGGSTASRLLQFQTAAMNMYNAEEAHVPAAREALIAEIDKLDADSLTSHNDRGSVFSEMAWQPDSDLFDRVIGKITALPAEKQNEIYSESFSHPEKPAILWALQAGSLANAEKLFSIPAAISWVSPKLVSEIHAELNRIIRLLTKNQPLQCDMNSFSQDGPIFKTALIKLRQYFPAPATVAAAAGSKRKWKPEAPMGGGGSGGGGGGSDGADEVVSAAGLPGAFATAAGAGAPLIRSYSERTAEAAADLLAIGCGVAPSSA